MLTLDRPQALNALDVPTLEALRERLGQIQDDSNQRCVLIRGAGERAFCTGADLKGAKSEATYAEAFFRSKAQSGTRGLYVRLMDLNDLGLTKPMVAAIDGYCLGGAWSWRCSATSASPPAVPASASGGVPTRCHSSLT